MTMQPIHGPTQTGRNINGTVTVLRARTGETVNELTIALGMSKSTMNRRRKHGDWSAEEVQQLADHFHAQVDDFYKGPDSLFRVTPTRAAEPYRAVIDQYPDSNPSNAMVA